jgi:hypothetical protein
MNLSMDGKRITPDEKTVAGAVEEVMTSSSDERDDLLTDLLCHVYGTLASQNG